MPAEKEAFNLPNETPLPFRCDEVLSADSHSEGIIMTGCAMRPARMKGCFIKRISYIT